ncbi:hypothetical protein GGR95_003191 [Sulfitobacter undariae]|uniref:Uncharacterized protein n=1 Tax=Sulfitobacter undariae TaxID=1563671 RepID=A0A7W6ED01_9RHOB|nr:hypothetical protein [Sulfitobacter undariae]MBB3995534.1 hypothetical protein [Sulfitobacter undariae]
MVQGNRNFVISWAMAEYLKLSPLPGAAKKLLLALIYFQENEREAWPTAEVYNGEWCWRYEGPGLQTHFATLDMFYDLGFAPSSKNSRFLNVPVEALITQTGLFDELKWHGGERRCLTWKFSGKAAVIMSDRERYALMHPEDIDACSAELDVPLLVQIYLTHKMKWPQFQLLHPDPMFLQEAHPGLLAAVGCSNVEVPDTRRYKAKLKKALEKWAKVKGYSFFVVFQQEGSRPGCTGINIRIRHSDTMWNDDQLGKQHPRDKLMVVRPEEKPAVRSETDVLMSEF